MGAKKGRKADYVAKPVLLTGEHYLVTANAGRGQVKKRLSRTKISRAGTGNRQSAK